MNYFDIIVAGFFFLGWISIFVEMWQSDMNKSSKIYSSFMIVITLFLLILK